MTKLNLVRHQQSNQRAINAFYKQHKQNVSCSANDSIFCAYVGNKIVASLFIRPLTSLNQPVLLLRSVFVSPEYRGQKIASKLITLALQQTAGAIHIVCENSLIEFYIALGFVETEVLSGCPQSILKELKGDKKLLVRKCRESQISI